MSSALGAGVGGGAPLLPGYGPPLNATDPYPMLQRNLLYTGVTRGRQLVVLVAQPKAVAIAVKGGLERRRWSKLHEWLRRHTLEPAAPAAIAQDGIPSPSQKSLKQ